MNYGIVDLGSNTVRLSLYRVLPEGDYDLLFSKKEMAGLVNYISGGVLSQEGIHRACSILEKFRELLRHFGVENFYIFATAPLRNIRNSEEAVHTIRKKTGLDGGRTLRRPGGGAGLLWRSADLEFKRRRISSTLAAAAQRLWRFGPEKSCGHKACHWGL